MAEAVRSVAADVALGDVGPEPDFSGQMIGRLKARIASHSDPSMTWQSYSSGGSSSSKSGRAQIRARQLGPKEERRISADIVMVLDIQTRSYVLNNGLLIQVKRIGPRYGLQG